MSSFSYAIKNDGVAILTFDLPGEKVNKLTTPVMEELNGILDELASKRDIKALVIRSGKEGNFIVGADIAEIRDITAPEAGEKLAAQRTGDLRQARSPSLSYGGGDTRPLLRRRAGTRPCLRLSRDQQ